MPCPLAPRRYGAARRRVYQHSYTDEQKPVQLFCGSPRAAGMIDLFTDHGAPLLPAMSLAVCIDSALAFARAICGLPGLLPNRSVWVRRGRRGLLLGSAPIDLSSPDQAPGSTFGKCDDVPFVGLLAQAPALAPTTRACLALPLPRLAARLRAALALTAPLTAPLTEALILARFGYKMRIFWPKFDI